MLPRCYISLPDEAPDIIELGKNLVVHSDTSMIWFEVGVFHISLVEEVDNSRFNLLYSTSTVISCAVDDNLRRFQKTGK